MKALVKSKSQPGLWLEDVAVPEIGINDVLIRVLRTGICGTDVHIYKWDEWAQKTIPVPMAVGHEFVGRIEAVGSNVVDFFPGDMVSGEGHVVCGRCRNCFAGRRHLCARTMGVGVNRPGAFAEYIALPMTNIWRHHEGIDLDVAAIFDPFGNAGHTALSFPVLGEDVLVTGAGPIGIMAAAVARHAGARFTVITDLNPYRLGIPTEEMSIDWRTVIFNMLTIKGIYGREMYETWYKMSVMLQSGLDISPVITHRYHYTEFEKGFEVMSSGNSGKVILSWD